MVKDSQTGQLTLQEEKYPTPNPDADNPPLEGDVVIYKISEDYTAEDALEELPYTASKVKFDDSNGNVTEYVGIESPSITEYLAKHFSDAGKFVVSGIQEFASSVQGFLYIPSDGQIGIATGGSYQVNIGSLVNMVNKGATALADFTYNVIENTVKEAFGNVEQQSPVIIGQIVAGILEGKDIDDVIAPIAANMVATGAIDALVIELTKENNFADLAAFKNNSAMAYDAVKGALAAVAVTAILNGRDAGIEDYTRAAATAGVQRIISNGITNSGYSALTREVTSTSTASGVTTVPTAAGAGAIAAITVLASSLLSGDGLTTDTVRSAAVAGATAAAATVLADAIVVGAKLGTAGGPLGVAVGIVIGAVLGLVVGKLFGGGQDRVYHNETIGSYKSGDTIIGLREKGALLRADATTPNVLGTDTGMDVLVGTDVKNIMLGMANDDFLEGRAGDDYLAGGDGNDHIEAGDGNDYAEGGSGNDIIFGGLGEDAILGGEGHDLISGGADNDYIEGGAGDDIIYGDSGNDVILGGDGADTISAGAGDDVIDGGIGDDVIDGSIGNDELHGGDGNDVLFGGDGNDTIHGDSGNDLILGDAGIDILYGDSGNDIIDGGANDDLIFGGLDNDLLFGGDGEDYVYGELGNDIIVGGKGDDLLDGGEGNDVYIFSRGDGKDTITDEAGTSDIIRFTDYAISELTLTKSGNDLVISSLDASDRITITNQITAKSVEYLILSDGKTINLNTLAFDGSGNATYSYVSDASSQIAQSTFAGISGASTGSQSYNADSAWYTDNYDTSVMTSDYDRELYNDVSVRKTVIKHRT